MTNLEIFLSIVLIIRIIIDFTNELVNKKYKVLKKEELELLKKTIKDQDDIIDANERLIKNKSDIIKKMSSISVN